MLHSYLQSTLSGAEREAFLEDPENFNKDIYEYIDVIKDSDGLGKIFFEYLSSSQSGIFQIDNQTFEHLDYSGEAMTQFGRDVFILPNFLQFHWDVKIIIDRFTNEETGVTADRLVFYEDIGGQALFAIDGFSNGDFGITLQNYKPGSIVGDDGDNTLDGTNGDDQFVGGSGRGFDIYNGGNGIDTIVFPSTSLGITVDLENGYAEGVEIDRDTLNSIENVEGGTGNDIIIGDAGANDLMGAEGNDTLNGGLGADIIDGGDGIDTIDLSGATNAQTINLVTNINTGGFAHNDIFLSIENVIGSNTRGDKVTGSAGANDIFGMGAGDILRGFNGDDMLDGGTGNDFLFGGRGADDLDGGDGIDWAVYTDSSSGVTVDLLAGTGSGGTAEGDTLVNIERIRGSFHDDDLTGDNGSNRILGDNGADTINGLGGVDIIRGGNGNDIINGGADRDAIQGNDDNDTINGGGGTDSLLGNAGDDVFVFEAGNDLDNIFDFDDAGNDRIDLSSFGFTDYSEVEAIMRQVNAHVRLDLGGSDIILLRNTDLADMGADDFIL